MVYPTCLPRPVEGRVWCYTVRPARLGPLSRPVVESYGGESALPELSGLFCRPDSAGCRLIGVT